jgi:hypothetical protein
LYKDERITSDTATTLSSGKRMTTLHPEDSSNTAQTTGSYLQLGTWTSEVTPLDAYRLRFSSLSF